MLLQLGEYKMDVAEVLRPGTTVNQYVVEEDEDKPAEEGSENIVHKCLKRRRRVRQAERHDEELEEALVRAECCLLHVVVIHPDLVVAGAQIKLGEEDCTLKFIEELFHHWNWVLVFDRLVVQGTVVHAHVPRAVALLHQDHQRRERRGTRPDHPLSQ
jgi:hypothetical protein